MRIFILILITFFTTNFLYGQSYSDLKESNLKGQVKTRIKNYYFSIDTSFGNVRISDSSKSIQTTFHYDKKGNLTNYEICEKYVTPNRKLFAEVKFKQSKKREIVFNSPFEVFGEQKNIINSDSIIWVTDYEYFENPKTDTLHKSRTLLDDKFRIIEKQSFHKDTILNNIEIVATKYFYNKNGLIEKMITTNNLKPLEVVTLTYKYLATDKLGNPTKYLLIDYNQKDSKSFISVYTNSFEYY